MDLPDHSGNVPELQSMENIKLADSDSDSEGWSDLDEQIDQPISCIFCPLAFKTTFSVITHCRDIHALAKMKARFDMDCYGFIKLVNFIRTHHVEPNFILNSIIPPPWESDEYLKPVQDDDPWLMIDFDEIDSILLSEGRREENKFHVVNAEGGLITLSEQHFSDLQHRIRTLTNEGHQKDHAIEGLLEDMEKMRATTQNLVSSGDKEEEAKEKCVKSVSLHDDQWYFSTYAHVGIHHQMLSDRVRTISYRDALINNGPSIANKTVLDLGCGTGILSMFAANAGAKQVIGIDQSDIIYRAIDIVRDNELSSKVNLIKGRLEDTSLPVAKVDVIVSEWMGYFLLYEGMLDSVIYARDQHLVEGGLLLPNRCSLNIVGISDIGQHNEALGFWSDVYGFRMNCFRQEVLEEPVDIVVENERVITQSSTLLNLDLHTCTTKNLDFISEFHLEVKRDDTLTALVGYFDVFFDLPSPVSFSTGPHAVPTHWKQTLFFLEEPLAVKKGEIVTGKLTCKRYMSAVRSLTVEIEISGKTQKYYFN